VGRRPANAQGIAVLALSRKAFCSEKNNVWMAGVEKRVNTKDALMELIRLYDVKLQDISVHKQDISVSFGLTSLNI
jgi:hypothetical protein